MTENIKISKYILEQFYLLLSKVNEFYNKYDNSLNHFGFLLTITALFLGIDSDSFWLKNIQVFFLLLTYIIILLFSIKLIVFVRAGKNSELFSSFYIFFTISILLLLYSITQFLFSEYKDQLIFYLKYLLIPLIGILCNFSLLIFLKYIKMFADVDSDLFEYFFLINLYLHIGSVYYKSENVFIFMSNLFSINFNSLNLLYLFLFIIYFEIFLFKRIVKIKFKKVYILISVFLCLLPYFIVNIFIPLIFYILQ